MTYDLVWKEGRLDLRDMNVLKGALSEMGSAHKACGFVVTLWAHLWVDHMWGIARELLGYPVRTQCSKGWGKASVVEE